MLYAQKNSKNPCILIISATFFKCSRIPACENQSLRLATLHNMYYQHHARVSFCLLELISVRPSNDNFLCYIALIFAEYCFIIFISANFWTFCKLFAYFQTLTIGNPAEYFTVKMFVVVVVFPRY